MMKISGPVSVGVFSLYNKKIYLFGDYHTIPKGLCPKCVETKHCLFITEFIDSLENADVFIETAWLEVDDKHLMKEEPVSSASVLHIVRSKYNDYLYGDKLEPTKRFHYADVRDERILWSLRRLVLYIENRDIHTINKSDVMLTQYFSNAKNLQKFANILVKSNDFQCSIQNSFNKAITNKILTSYPFPSKKQPGKIHRIRKQILKLPKTLQNTLLRYHKDKCKEILINYNQIINKPDFTNLSPLWKIIIVIMDGVFPILTHLMDIYLLARLLYYIEHKGTEQIVTYTGSLHTENYVSFFTKYMKESKLLYHENNYRIGSKRIKRCVTIP